MTTPIAFVIDDDEAMRESLRFLLESARLEVRTFESGNRFLEEWRAGALQELAQAPACVIADLRMPGLSGLELHDQLKQDGAGWLPMIIITGHGDIANAVRAVKSGVSDYLEKPFRDQDLLDRIFRLYDEDRERRARRQLDAATSRKLATLTPRERQVLDRVVQGKPSKQIAFELGVTIKAIEAHRARIMDKMEARSVQELVRAITLLSC